jgi:uncharacterized protein (DUF58 family)
MKGWIREIAAGTGRAPGESREYSFLKKIRLDVGRKLDTLFAGQYHSAFRGMGLSFESVREYQYGDDIRNIEWNVSARMNHVFVKEFIEERELSILLMIDISGSVDFGADRTKRDVVLEMAALLLHLAQINNDRISVLLFTDRVEKFLRPRKGRRFILKALEEIMKCEPQGRGTDIGAALDFARRVLKKRSVIFCISDFLDDRNDFALKMRHLGRRHDIIPVQVSDPAEREMRGFGLMEMVDLESGESFLSDVRPGVNSFPELQEFDVIRLSTDESIEGPLLRFFEKRNRTRRSGK